LCCSSISLFSFYFICSSVEILEPVLQRVDFQLLSGNNLPG
jgi:hypothetical protein